MADLTYLNEGAVLHNLKQRYYYKLIYVSIDVQTKLTDSFFLSLSLFPHRVSVFDRHLENLWQKFYWYSVRM